MLDHDLVVALLYHLSQNQSTLGMALGELVIWAKRHESGEIYDVVMSHLQVLRRNANLVAEAIVVLMVDRWGVPDLYGWTSLRGALGTMCSRIFEIFLTG